MCVFIFVFILHLANSSYFIIFLNILLKKNYKFQLFFHNLTHTQSTFTHKHTCTHREYLNTSSTEDLFAKWQMSSGPSGPMFLWFYIHLNYQIWLSWFYTTQKALDSVVFYWIVLFLLLLHVNWLYMFYVV